MMDIHIVKLLLCSNDLTYLSLLPCMRVMRTPEIYCLIQIPIFSAVLLTIVIILFISSLDLFILPNCNSIPFDQCLSISPTSLHLLINFLLSASMYLIFLDSTFKWDHAFLLLLCIWLISQGIRRVVSSQTCSFSMELLSMI